MHANESKHHTPRTHQAPHSITNAHQRNRQQAVTIHTRSSQFNMQRRCSNQQYMHTRGTDNHATVVAHNTACRALITNTSPARLVTAPATATASSTSQASATAVHRTPLSPYRMRNTKAKHATPHTAHIKINICFTLLHHSSAITLLVLLLPQVHSTNHKRYIGKNISSLSTHYSVVPYLNFTEITL